MESVACNLCGSAESRPVFEMPDTKFFPDEWFTVVECVKCGLGFVNPRPSRAEIGRHYPANYYDYLAPELHQQRYANEAQYIERYAPPGHRRRLLDVGCANGDFPRFMKARGWTVEGVEVSATTVPVTDFPIHRAEFPDAKLAPASFDVVTAWAVLEHVHDPMAYFLRAHEVLAPGGAFIFTVPNFASLASRRLYREDPPRHLYFYSEATVAGFLERTGLRYETSVHGNDVYEMLPTNWLRYYLQYRWRNKPMRFADLPETPDSYFARLGLAPSLAARARYAFTHPFTVLDGMTRPLHERWSMARRNYGIVTFVARKPGDPRAAGGGASEQ